MKIRSGFVSNSSSSSFVILGVEDRKICNKIADIIKMPKEEDGWEKLSKFIMDNMYDYGLIEFDDIIMSFCDNNIDSAGVPMHSLMDDNKTIREIKQDVANKISSFIEEDVSVDCINLICGISSN